MRFCPYFIRGLIILPLFWNQMFRLYFDRFDKDFNNKLETICVHFKSGRNLTLFWPCQPIQSEHREAMVQPGPMTLGLPLIPSNLSLHSPEKTSISSLSDLACSWRHRHLGQHDVEAWNGRRRNYLGPVWFEAWTTCLAKSVVCKLPENLMKSAWPGKLENGLFWLEACAWES